ncbi:MAG TPA: aminotransferase class V-fold PLP-dependent enzyme, partial [Thermoanaerobaculia bacterium]|nr:aminotransferase class V-fold PLP-dependent enzyme [Thermoanaerobaculia bacterium]
MSSAAFRELFPITRNLVYFNHAAVGPLSTRAYEAMERHARDQRDYGALHWRDWYAEHDKLRESAARLIGATPSEIAILKNTSEGLSFVAGGLQWREGDNVVTTAIEFPSNWIPWKRLARHGVECRVAQLPTLEQIAPLVDDRTRVVSVSSVAFHNGFVAELEALGDLCAKRNILFCVDAIQSIGVVPMDVRRMKIGALAADSHKWMCGPETSAIFYVAEEWRDAIEPIEEGWTNTDRKGRFIDAGLEWRRDARRYEAGSPNTNGMHGTRAAIDLLLEVGIDVVYAEAMKIANALADGLESIGWRVALQHPLRSPIVGVTPPNVDTTLLRWHALLEAENVVCAPREGLLRFSPHFYNTIDEAR